MSDKEIEARLQAAGANAPRLTPADIEAAILSEFYFTAEHGIEGAMARGELHARHKDVDTLNEVVSYSTPAHVTVCLLMLKNGTKIVGVNHGALVAENFRADIARNLARQAAVDQIWPLLGYEMRTRLSIGAPAAPVEAVLGDVRIVPAAGATPTPSPVAEPEALPPIETASYGLNVPEDAETATLGPKPWKPRIGNQVMVKGCIANGTDEHAGLVTRVHGAGEGAFANVTAFPDLQSPKIFSSIPVYTSRAAADADIPGATRRRDGFAYLLPQE